MNGKPGRHSILEESEIFIISFYKMSMPEKNDVKDCLAGDDCNDAAHYCPESSILQ
jgi:hypothetical protein